MTRILILYASTDGHTITICQRLKQTIEHAGNTVAVIAIEEAETIALESFDKIVIGASIRYGKHQPAVFKFIEANLSLLDHKPNAFFTVNIVARKPGKNRPETNPYMQKFLRQTRWKPRQLAVFAGKLNYPRYRPLDRLMIRFIMLMTKGPTDPNAIVEFTDWQQVEAFGHVISEM